MMGFERHLIKIDHANRSVSGMGSEQGTFAGISFCTCTASSDVTSISAHINKARMHMVKGKKDARFDNLSPPIDVFGTS